MKVLTIGDPHLKSSSQHLVVSFLKWIHELVQEHKPDMVVNLGDTFHTHNVIRSEIMAHVDDHLLWMNEHFAKNKGYPCYMIIVGNHDMAHHKMPDVHAWLPFKGKYKNIWIIDEPFSASDVAFIPYIDDPQEFQSWLTKFKRVPTIFCHQTFRGANFGFITTKEGAVVPTDHPGQIISGHIHKQQDLGCVWYPGTPFAQEASDHDEVKGVFIYDTETKERTFFKSPLPQWVTRKATPSNYQDVISRMDKTDKNHLVLEGPGPEVNAIAESKVFRDLKKEYGFSVKKQSTSTTKSEKSLRKVSTVEDAVVEYVDRIYDGAVDKVQLKAKCLSALQQQEDRA